MLEFTNKFGEGDAPYLEWLKNHQDGFVLQTKAHPDPDYMNLHSAKCKSISKVTSSKKASPFTAAGYIKICSDDPTELFKYAISQGRSIAPHHSRCCARFVDTSIFDSFNHLVVEHTGSAGPTILELSKQAKKAGRSQPKKVSSEVTTFARSDEVVKYAKAVSEGACSLCKCVFEREPQRFLDCHHIVFLRDGGEDTRENVVAVCPNCHRKLHLRSCKKTVAMLKSLAKSRAMGLDDLEAEVKSS